MLHHGCFISSQVMGTSDTTQKMTKHDSQVFLTGNSVPDIMQKIMQEGRKFQMLECCGAPTTTS